MPAVWMRTRAEMRVHWRAWLAIALAFGVAGGAASAAAAGARRTKTAYPRFVVANEGFDVIAGGLTGGPEEIAHAQTAIAALPQVADFALTQFVTDRILLPSGALVTFPEALVLGDIAGHEFVTVNVAKVIRGRMFDPDAPDEGIIDIFAAERMGVEVGDRVTLLLSDRATSERSVRRPVTIVGVVIGPGGLPAVGGAPLSAIAVTPAFLRANAANLPPNEEAPSVRLRRGSADIEAFIAGAHAIAPKVDIPVTGPRHIAGVQKMLRYDVGALWILSALIALAALLILGQAVARQLWLEGGSNTALRALGMSRSQLIASDIVRPGLTGLVGAVVTFGIAIAASALTPRGIVRLVEPDPGVHLDVVVLSIGAVATFIAAILVAVIPAIRVARGAASRTVARPSRFATALAAAGAGPSAVTGVRLALDPGRGVRAVPVRATIGGVALALAALTAASTFTQSFDRLIGSPGLSGYRWDVFAGSEDAEADAKVLAADPDVVVATPGGYANMSIEGKQLVPLVYEPGGIEPTVLAGRAPRTPDEIALGTGLLRSLRKRIGDTIAVQPSGTTTSGAAERAQTYTIVGRVVVPPVFFQQVEPGESSAMTIEGARRLDPEEHSDGESIPHLIRYRPGIDVRAKVDELRAQLPGLFVGQVRQQGADLSALSRSAELPVVLSNVLLLMAVGTLTHTLISSIRKRRRDLAILKALGLLTRQVRAAVAWQATVLVVIALLIGVPTGIAAGRWGWTMFANSIGVVPSPDTAQWLALVVAPIGAITLANLIALLPGRSAAATRPALVLRVE